MGKVLKVAEEKFSGIRLHCQFHIDMVHGQLLLFPVLAVCLSAIAFLFGGSCALWQWWLAFALSSAFALTRLPLKRAVASSAFLALLLLGLKCLAVVLVDDAGGDNACYHLPAIRMLGIGWNPVRDATPEAIESVFGLDPGKMRVLHVLFTEKAVWVFNALFYLFAREPFAFLFPLPLMLLASVAGTMNRVFSDWHLLSKALVLWVLWVAAPCSISGPTDFACALAGSGLMLSMLGDLKGKGRSWLELICYSFWMMNAKAPGLISCFVFWCVYAAWLIASRRGRRISAMRFLSLHALTLMVLFVVVSFSPYATAWRDYGHPLYPFRTANQELHPVRDITYDFDYVDPKYERIGRVGNFANAYVSPSLVRMFHRAVMHDKQFAPVRRIWRMDREQGRLKEETSPTTTGFRLAMCLVIFIVLWLPSLRPIGAMVLAGLFFFPCKYMGYMRYLPWYCLAEACLCGYAMEWLLSRKLRAAAVAYAAMTGFQVAFHTLRYAVLLAISINVKMALEDFRPTTIYGTTWDLAFIENGGYAAEPDPDDKDAIEQRRLLLETKGDPARTTLNNLILLKRTCAMFHEAEVSELAVTDVSQYIKTPLGFYVVGGTTEFGDLRRVPDMAYLRGNVKSASGFVLRAWFISLPKLIWRRLSHGCQSF